MAKAFGIVNFAGNHIAVEGMQEYRPVGAFSFLGRYRVIDFPISNMSNSGIDHIQVYIRRKPQSLTAHLGTGRHYNINSKSGNLQILYSGLGMNMSLYNNDIASYIENLEYIEQQLEEYVVIAPSYMIYTQDYNKLLNTHIESGADITLLYHSVDNAKEYFLNCYAVNLNKQKGVLSLEQNHGNTKNKNIFMDTYIMKKENLTVDEMDNILNKKSGVLGISGVSSDFRDIEEAAEHGNDRAETALDVFAYKVAKRIGAYAAAMNGVDAIVFTAGLGENSGTTRRAICDYLGFLGVHIDSYNNSLRGKALEISATDSRVRVFVIPTNEELVIARDTKELLDK